MMDRSCASAASATGSPTASLPSCTSLVRCSKAVLQTDEPDTVTVELEEHRERLQVAGPEPVLPPCQQPKLAITQLASLASISTAATATQQIITTTVVHDNSSHQSIAATAAGETSATQPTQQRELNKAGSSSTTRTASDPEVSCPQTSQRPPGAEVSSPTPSTSTAVAAPRRICTLKVKIFLIKHLSKLVACNKKMFLPVKSNT
uniref:Uncharacterized protein n=1 Tax=Anopheles epiroticus TaxID=199890 RepID=A0A182PKT7_9DIPT